ncbi:hypothetical protein L1049_014627 [Liquidambar formosana]|uniref:Endoplasmic reticulum vesicle transporter C-terminal domain-containing protein n=1 Tax=Liquidambar formosana TaxID=63359 RepID=A0AAP0X1Y0_LIQFO
MYQYFIKVVPTIYTDIRGHTIQSNQFSVTEHFRSPEFGRPQYLPGVFFFYDLSPIKVTSKRNMLIFALHDKHLCYNWRYFHSCGNFGFIHIPWSKGDQKENGNWKIQLIIWLLCIYYSNILVGILCKIFGGSHEGGGLS